MFGPQDHHSDRQRRVAECMASREKAFAAKDDKAARYWTGEIENARAALKPEEKRALHPTFTGNQARRK